jgi:hypothetical protein
MQANTTDVLRNQRPRKPDEERKKEAYGRQSAKLARHHHAQPRRISRLGRSARSREGRGYSRQEFVLDQDQQRRLLIRERQDG